ncbi:hypothetical protein AAFF_G00328190 [Aldrovandia affinis]|uniref:non-specific serine/threonine protein kinase n=1 Tax=Aldrovandia affinis TaxID=143900 RepID=A0AAD7T9M4_9TELE|nr:hypothetical protein AAFF_G00328190 [Aldrovandia affinis]
MSLKNVITERITVDKDEASPLKAEKKPSPEVPKPTTSHLAEKLSPAEAIKKVSTVPEIPKPAVQQQEQVKARPEPAKKAEVQDITTIHKTEKEEDKTAEDGDKGPVTAPGAAMKDKPSAVPAFLKQKGQIHIEEEKTLEIPSLKKVTRILKEREEDQDIVTLKKVSKLRKVPTQLEEEVFEEEPDVEEEDDGETWGWELAPRESYGSSEDLEDVASEEGALETPGMKGARRDGKPKEEPGKGRGIKPRQTPSPGDADKKKGLKPGAGGDKPPGDSPFGFQLKAVPLKFVKELKDIVLQEAESIGSSAVFECEVSPSTAITTWMKDESNLRESPKHKFTSDGKDRKLAIIDVQLSDTGEYTCVAKLGNKEKTSKAKLIVEELPVRFTKTLEEEVSVLKGQPMYLTCELSKDKDVVWKKNGKPLKAIAGKVAINVIGLQRAVTVQDSGEEDAGVYTCQCENVKTEGNIKVIEIVRDWLVKPLRDQHVKPKATATFKGELFKETPNWKWFKGDNEIPKDPTDKTEVKKDGKELTLTIKNAVPDDIGEYAMEVEGHRYAAKLTLGEREADILKPLSSVEVYEKQSANFDTEISEEDVPGEWKLKGQILTRSPTCDIKAEGKKRFLTLKNLHVDQSGEITYQGLNAVTSAVLTVKQIEMDFTVPLKDVSVLEKKQAKFECTITRDVPIVMWTKGSEIITSGKKYEIIDDGKKHILVINNCNFDDEGHYAIEALGKKSIAKLTVEGLRLNFITPLKDQTVKESKTAQFEVELSHENVPVTWYRNENKVHPSRTVLTHVDGKKHILEIQEVTLDDTCQIKAEAKGISTVAKLMVIEGDAYFTVKLQDYTAVEKDDIILDCELSKEVPVKWYHNDTEIKASKMVTMKAEGKRRILCVKRVEEKNKGNYICDCGTDKTNANINIEARDIKVVRPLYGVELFDGETARFEVEISATDVHAQWKLKGEVLTPSTDIEIIEDGAKHVLTLYNCKIPQSGEVAFQAANAKCAANLKVKELPLAFMTPLCDVQVYEKDEARFECEVSREAKNFRWLKGTQEVKADEKFQILHEGKRHTLVVKSAAYDDEAKYMFEAEDKRTSGKLIIQGIRLEFVRPIKDVTVKERETAEFSIELSHEKVPVFWFKNDVRLHPSKVVHMSEDGKVHTLSFKEVSIDDTSLIKAEAMGKSSEAMLTVLEGEPYFTTKLQDYTAVEKDEVVLVCELSKSAAEVKWFKDGQEITPSKNVLMKSEGKKRMLIVKKAEKANIGEYTCDCGSDKTTAKLNIEDRDIKIIRPLYSVEVTETESARFETEISEEDVHGHWKLNGEALHQSPDSEMKEEGTKHILILYNVRMNQAGPVDFQAANAKSSAQLRVKARVIGLLRPLRDVTVTAGETATFDCELSYEGIKVEWFLGSTKLEPSDRIVTRAEGRAHTLTLRDVKMTEAGEVKLTAKDFVTQANLIVNEPPVEFTKPLEDQTVEEEATATLECEVSRETAEVRWFRDGQEIRKNKKYEIVADGRKRQLLIHDCTLDDSKTYTCDAKDFKTSAFLSVEPPHVEFSKPLHDVEVKEKESARFECEVSRENAKVRWFKDSSEIRKSKKYEMIAKGVQRILIINKSAFDDEAEYECDARTSKSSGMLTVIEEEATFTKNLSNVEGTETDSIKMICEVSKASADVAWYKGDQELPEGGRYEHRLDGRKRILIIQDLRIDDTGEYNCRLPSSKTSATLRINELAAEFISRPQSQEVVEGEKATFVCSVSKDTYEVKWLRGDKEIQAGEKYDIISDGKRRVLVVKDCMLKDEGGYVALIGSTRATADLFVMEKLRIIIPIKDIQAKEGQEIVFNCEVNSEDAKAKWLINDETIFESSKYIMVQKDTVFSLRIKDTQNSDEANYTVALTNQRGEQAKSSAKLSVQEEDLRIIEPLEDCETQEKRTVTFSCKVNRLNVTVKWMKGGQELTLNKRILYKLDKNKHTLTIKDCSLADEGEYSAMAGSDKSTAELIISEAPTDFLSQLQDQTITEFEDAEFSCEISKEKAEVKWYKNGREIREGPRYRIEKEGKTCRVHIKECRPDDECEYACETPVEIVRPPSDIFEPPGSDVVFEVELNKDRVEVKWLRNNMIIVQGDKYQMMSEGKVHRLQVCEIRPRDQGEYRIMAKDKDARAKLELADFPGPVKNLNVVDTADGEVSLAWDEPESDGGSKIIAYVVERRDVKRKTWTLATDRVEGPEYCVTGLQTDSMYFFRVCARNRVGSGPNVETDKPVQAKNKFDVPEAPQNVKVGNVNKFGATVSWERPLSDGGSEITAYIIELRDRTSVKWTPILVTKPESRTAIINEVVENKEYIFRVRAENKAGVGKPSMATDPVKIMDPIARPSPPLNFNYSEQNRDSVQLTWETPLSNGGSMITGYIIEKCEDGTDKWLRCNARLCQDLCYRVYGLKYGLRYHYRVSAENAAGVSDPAKTIGPLLADDTHVAPTLDLSAFKDGLEVIVPHPLAIRIPITGYPVPTAKWNMGDKAVTAGDRVSLVTRVTYTELVITPSVRPDKGTYTVHLENDVTTVSGEIQVNVIASPSAPRDFKAAEVTRKHVHLMWEAPEHDGGSPLTGYQIEKRDVSRKTWVKVIAGVQDLEYTVTDVIEGKEYLFRVTACNKCGPGEPAYLDEPVNVSSPATVPDPPENLKWRDKSASGIFLSWEPPKYDGGSAIKGYIVDKCQRGTDKWEPCGQAVPELKFEVTGLIEGQWYAYRVRALNKLGASRPCRATDEILAVDPKEPPEIQLDVKLLAGLTVKAGAKIELPASVTGKPEPKITWTKADLTLKTDDRVSINTKPGHSTVTIANSQRDDTATYIIEAVNSSGRATATVDVNILDKPGPPAAFDISDITNESCFLAWNPPRDDGGSKVTNYIAERKATNSLVWHKLSSTIKQTTFKACNLEAHKEYVFRVFAENQFGVGAHAEHVPIVAHYSFDPPGAPTKLDHSDIAKDSLTLTWNEPDEDGGSPITGYWVERLDQDSDKWMRCNKLPIRDSTFRVKGLPTKKKYKFRVMAENIAGPGQPSKESGLILVKDPIDPPWAPGKPTVKDVAKTSAFLQWTKPEHDGGAKIESYVIELLKSGTVDWVRVADGVLMLEHFLKGLMEKQEYSFRVRAVNIAGESEPSEPSDPVLCKERLSPPSPPRWLTVINISKNNADLKWTAPEKDGGSPITNYIVEKRDAKRKGWQAVDTTVKETKYTVTPLNEGSLYLFRIAAENAVGQSEYCELEDSVLAKDTFTTPGPPYAVTVEDVTKTHVDLKWEAPKNDGGRPIERYVIEKKEKMGTRWVKSGKTSGPDCKYRITDVIEGTEAQFQIRAENEAGVGHPSEPTEILKIEDPTGPPSPPLELHVTEVNRDHISITWKPPDKNGGSPIIGYHIELCESGTEKWMRMNSRPVKELKYKAEEGIIPEKEYIMRVRAVNSIAVSEPSEISENVFAKDSDCNPTLEVQTRDIVVVEGEKLHLPIVYRAVPQPKVSWHKDGKELKAGDRVTFRSEYLGTHLEITSSLHADAGTYTITLENKLGSTTGTINVKVVGLPGPCKDIVASDITKNFCKISWIPPDSDGGSPILHYCLQRREAGRRTYIAVMSGENKVSWPVKDLIPNGEYYFRVKAVNKIGGGEFIELRNPVIAEDQKQRPDPPVDVETHNPSSKSITLTWKPPMYDGGCKIMGYILEKMKKGDDKFERCNDFLVPVLSYTVKGLTEGKEYQFRVCAENAAGVSDPSRSTPMVKAIDTIDPPKVFLSGSLQSGFSIKKGGEIRLDAYISGSPYPTITWHRNNRTIRPETMKKRPEKPIVKKKKDKDAPDAPDEPEVPSYPSLQERLSIDLRKQGESTAIVQNSVRDDHGVFTIKVENDHGIASASCEVIVLDAPGPPVNMVFEDIRNNSVLCKWDPPLDDGGSEILNYILEQKDNSKAEIGWITVNSTLRGCKYPVTKLIEGKEYIFRAIAENKCGAGPPCVSVPLVAKNPFGEGAPGLTEPVIVKDPQVPPVVELDISVKNGVTIMAGLELKLPAHVTGRPPPYVVWTKDDGKLDKDRMVVEEVGQDSTLTILKTTRKDCGKYQITAKNSSGHKSAWSRVDVVDVPGLVIDLKPVVVTRKLMMLNWGDPVDDGGSDLTGFIVERRDAKMHTWRQPIDTFASKAEIVEKPVIAKHTKESMLVNWEPPLNDGGSTITGYWLEKSEKGSAYWARVNRAAITKRGLKSWECSATHLTEGIEYQFRVMACNAAGLGPPSEPSEPALAVDPLYPPGMPSNLEVADVTKNSVTLSWNPPEKDGGRPIKGYIIEIQDEGTTDWMRVNDPEHLHPTTEFTVPNLRELKKCRFRVVAVNDIGESEPCPKTYDVLVKEIQVEPSITVDVNVQELLFVQAGSTIRIPAIIEGRPIPKVTWEFEGGAKTVMKDGIHVLPVDSQIESTDTTSTITIPMSKRNHSGRYTITAKNKAGQRVANVRVNVLDVPGPPKELKVTDITRSTCRIIWKLPDNDGGERIKSYFIEKKNVGGKAWTKVNPACASQAFVVPDLLEGQEYLFRVCAENRLGFGPHVETTEVAKARDPIYPPDPPTKVKVNLVTKDTVTLTWVPPKNNGGAPITHYIVERLSWDTSGKEKETWKQCNKRDVEETTFKVEDLKEGGEYEFRVKAVNEAGASRPSATAGPMFVKDQTCAPTIELRETLEGEEGTDVNIVAKIKGCPFPTLTWQKASLDKADDKTDVQYDQHVNKLVSDDKCTLMIQQSRREDTALYTITASNSLGKASKDIRLTVLGRPGPPIGPIKFEEIFAERIAFSWQPPKDDGGSKITNYVVEKREDNRKSWVHISDAPKECLYTVQRLTEGHEYEFRVKAQNKYGVGPPLNSEPEKARNLFTVPGQCEKPTVPEVTRDCMIVSWDEPEYDGGSMVTGYWLERKETTSKRWTRVNRDPIRIAPLGVSYDVTGLIEGSQYQFRVIAINAAGCGLPSLPSDPVTARDPIEPPGPPTPKVTDWTKSTVDVEWIPPLNDGGSKILGYFVEYKEEGKEEWEKAKDKEIRGIKFVVSGLKELGLYRFRVRAVNSAGVGEPGDVSEVIEVKDRTIAPELDLDASVKEKIVVHAGGIIRILAYVSGKPAPQITWSRDEVPVPEEAVVETTAISSALDKLMERKFTHGGLKGGSSYEFRVSAVNAIGQGKPSFGTKPVACKDELEPPTIDLEFHDKTIVRVEMKAKDIFRVPEAPLQPVVKEVFKDTALLTWIQPRDGGKPITNYIVEKKETMSNRWSRAGKDRIYPDPEYWVPDLLHGCEYEFRVMAENEVGVGDCSPPSKPVFAKDPVVPPSPPVLPVAVDKTKESVTLSWQPPLNNGRGKIIGYLIEYQKAGNEEWMKGLKTTYVTKDSCMVSWEKPEDNGDSPKSYMATDPISEPDPPKKMDLLEITKNSAVLGWVKPLRDGGAKINGYVVDYLEEDSGYYSLSAENSTGKVNQILRVIIMDIPGPPEPPFEISEMDIDACTLSWHAPREDGGSNITNYVIEKFDVSRGDWVTVVASCTATTYRVGKLTPGKEYSFRVRAENRFGISAPIVSERMTAKFSFDVPSEPKNCCVNKVNKDLTRKESGEYTILAENKSGSKTGNIKLKVLDKPGPPASVKIGNVYADRIKLNWEPPIADGGSEITNYIIDKRETSRANWAQVTANIHGQLTSCSVEKLIEGHEYQFRVSAENKYGVGDPILTDPVVAKNQYGNNVIILFIV